MEVLKGDFIGFTIGDFHSSELGILRTSNGDRFDEDLVPSFSDSTSQVPGGDGQYYWKSLHSEKTFSIPIAYDSMTETQFRNLRRAMSSKDLIPLVFDERPYKEYIVKPTGTPQLNYICFDENDQRVYKGEGTLEFTAFYPYARNRHIKGKGLKYLNEFVSNGEYSVPEWIGFASNRDEWSASSNMLMEQGDYDKCVKLTTSTPKYSVKIYNAGDLESCFNLYVPITNKIFPLKKIYLLDKDLKENGTKMVGKVMEFYDDTTARTLTTAEAEINKYICIEGRTNLLMGCDKDFQPTGSIFNKFIKSGDFFTLPTQFAYPEAQLVMEPDSASDPCGKLEYDYWYY